MLGTPLTVEERALRESGQRRRSYEDAASEDYPSVHIRTDQADQSVHVFKEQDGEEYCVWINPGDCDFAGLCIASGPTRDAAVAQAVAALEAITEHLQGPPPAEGQAR